MYIGIYHSSVDPSIANSVGSRAQEPKNIHNKRKLWVDSLIAKTRQSAIVNSISL